MRPRTRSPFALTRDQRIEHIVRLMRDGTWQRGGAATLAAEWNVPLRTAEHDVAEAATVFRVAKKLFTEEARDELVRRFAAFAAS